MAALLNFWSGMLASQSRYLPHSVCLDYGPSIWLHATADGLIALSYYSIPFALLYFTWKREDLSFRWMFAMFGLFILACGTTHLLNVWTLFYPDYLLSGGVKILTAAASVGTAIALWPLLPKALALPSPHLMEEANTALRHEIKTRQAAEDMVRQANLALERRVSERTAELENANMSLRNEIDRRTTLERELRHAKEEAERANIDKSKFLATAAHDVRQPVQAMFYFTEALSYQLTDERGRELLVDLNRSLAALKALLDSLLDMSKLDAGVVVPRRHEFPVSDLLDRAAAEFAPSAAEKGIRLAVRRSGAVIDSDPALLGRVLQNLVANAVRYTQKGRVLVGCRRRGRFVVIEVWDTGIGIPKERLADIFEEFTQLGKDERDQGQGLGLGLAIVHRLCRLLGHEITVHSQLGRGSVFGVTVPLAAVDRKRAV